MEFQSTHPIRDATSRALLISARFSISIHTSHTGCDVGLYVASSGLSLFQSTHPIRDATFEADESCCPECQFQFTHPIRDATAISLYLANATYIFQSTHPIRDATDWWPERNEPYYISIHTSHTGCDLSRKVGREKEENFNPHIPYRMRLGDVAIHAATHDFNPHIPYGMRLDYPAIIKAAGIFQSTHPIRDATVFLHSRHIIRPISIHTSHTGCDL